MKERGDDSEEKFKGGKEGGNLRERGSSDDESSSRLGEWFGMLLRVRTREMKKHQNSYHGEIREFLGM